MSLKEDMLNTRADDMLKEEVKQKEISSFLETNYVVNYLVTQRTIQRWLVDLGIDCLQPRPERNNDIRYYRYDVLKLEKIKRVNLLRKKDKELGKHDIIKAGSELNKYLENSENNYYDHQASLKYNERKQQK